MANLRTNNLSGEQGQNAFRGSVFFDGSSFLSFNAAIWNSQASDSCTFECWLWVADLNSARNIFDLGNEGDFSIQTDGQIRVHPVASNWKDTNNSVSTQSWHHIALVQESGRKDVYINGVKSSMTVGSGDPVASNWSNTNANTFNLGDDGTYRDFFRGYMSNVRVIKGVSLYDDDFTPPFTELKATDSNTSLLCCQNSDDVTQEETGKTITGNGSLATAGYNKTQPKVIPPYGVDAGNTFGGPIQQSSQGYMCFPTGRTEERGRGRGVYGGGGISSPTNPANISFIDVQSQGNTTTFGSLTSENRAWTHGFGSSTRAIWSGGGNTGGGTLTNTIDFVTIATTSNATDFGDATVATTWRGSFSNDTRGISGGGYLSPANINTIDFVTISNLGNATDFGDLTQVRRGAGAMASSTRGVFAGGFTPSVTNIMDFVTIATTANATDFGDLVQASRHDSGGCSNGVRGIIGGGNTGSSNHTNVIQFITIASEGNATDFGDLNNAVEACGTLDNSIRAVFSGSYTPSLNTMDFITIASTGNASDFGDNTEANYAMGGTSDSHGGLS